MRSTRSLRSLVRPPLRARRGFTLLETALTTVIIGVGVLAMVEAQQAFLVRNSWSTNASTATYLANEIRELSSGLPRHDRFTGGIFFTDPASPGTFTGWGREGGETTVADLDDIDDLDGAVFGSATTFPPGFTMTARYAGPINALRELIPEVRYDGTVETFVPEEEAEPVAVPLRGWTQIVTVQKVEPYALTTAVADSAQLTQGSTILRAVDRYPLRVTVTALWQPDPLTPAAPIASTSWIVMP